MLGLWTLRLQHRQLKEQEGRIADQKLAGVVAWGHQKERPEQNGGREQAISRNSAPETREQEWLRLGLFLLGGC